MSAPKETGILFNGEMVRAILDGRKSVTRRVMKPAPDRFTVSFPLPIAACPYGVPGDLLYVRETWQEYSLYGGKKTCFYRADGEHQLMGTRFCYDATYHDFTDGIGEGSTFESQNKWRPSIHMPKWAARIWLRIISVRAERVQEISEEDAEAEGISGSDVVFPSGMFSILWNQINEKRGFGWAENPWVWVIDFERTEK